MDKVVHSAEEAVADIGDGASPAVGRGSGLCVGVGQGLALVLER